MEDIKKNPVVPRIQTDPHVFWDFWQHVKVSCELFVRHRRLIGEANVLYSKKDEATAYDVKMAEVEKVDILFTANVGYVFNALIIGFIPVALVAVFFLFTRMNWTRVSIDVEVTELDWLVTNTENGILRFDVESDDSASAFFQYDSLYINLRFVDSGNLKTVELLPSDSRSVVGLRAEFPENKRLSLRREDALNLRIKVPGAPDADTTVVSYDVIYQKRILKFGDSALAAVDNQQILNLKRTMRRGESFSLEGHAPVHWSPAERLFAKDIRFEDGFEQKVRRKSTVLSGSVKLLETSDSAIQLYERDRLHVVFKEPAELFLKTTPRGITVHIEGVATEISCGPEIMGADNNRMPERIKSFVDRSPQVLAFLSVFLPLLAALFFRQRKSI